MNFRFLSLEFVAGERPIKLPPLARVKVVVTKSVVHANFVYGKVQPCCTFALVGTAIPHYLDSNRRGYPYWQLASNENGFRLK